MILLSVEEIVSLHGELIEKTGGSHGVRNYNLLESAVFSALNGFEGYEVYPSVEEKAARLMFALTKNHAFTDGNKRIGAFVMLMTLQLNDRMLNYSQKELIELGLSVADDTFNYDDILNWINSHLTK
ncbi:MAG: type II toxin-antitoxin system death-on-curing family toxin [Clostridia bacterium]|nr:type II toxin-antitoxin system death-on-curing family toxin [Clostridia bacterium]